MNSNCWRKPVLDQASEIAAGFDGKSPGAQLINEAQNELELSEGSDDNEGIKERTGFRLERRVAAVGRHMGRGNGYRHHRGYSFVGLFGTVWGIMNSFIGIAQTQTTNGRCCAGYRRSAVSDRNWSGRSNSSGCYLQHFRTSDWQL